MEKPDFEQILARLVVRMNHAETRGDTLEAVQDAVVDAGWLERWELEDDQDWAFIQFIEDEIAVNLITLPDLDGVKAVS